MPKIRASVHDAGPDNSLLSHQSQNRQVRAKIRSAYDEDLGVKIGKSSVGQAICDLLYMGSFEDFRKNAVI